MQHAGRRVIGLALLGASAVAGAGAGAGCRGRRAAEADARERPVAAMLPATAAPFALAAGTPAGGLRAWTAEVQGGLAGLPDLAARDVAAAQKRALEWYLTRQEYIEMYWGSTGKLTRGAQLGPAVAEAERRFHLVLAQLQPGKPVQSAALAAGLSSLWQQYARVVSAAEAAGAPMDPHAVAAAGAARGSSVVGGSRGVR